MKDLLIVLSNFRSDIDFENEKNLITDGLLGSFDILTLISILNEEYNIEITEEQLVPENFNNIESISNLIKQLKGNK